jgi:hypothetical protein
MTPVNFSLYGNETHQVVTKFNQAAVQHLLTSSLHPHGHHSGILNRYNAQMYSSKRNVWIKSVKRTILDKGVNTVKTSRDGSSLQRGSIVQCVNVLPNYGDYINRLIHPEKSSSRIVTQHSRNGIWGPYNKEYQYTQSYEMWRRVAR